MRGFEIVDEEFLVGKEVFMGVVGCGRWWFRNTLEFFVEGVNGLCEGIEDLL
jgi:hypothetical protein